MGENFWFADVDEEQHKSIGFIWQPVLQFSGGCSPLPLWFASEDECIEFIAAEILGIGVA